MTQALRVLTEEQKKHFDTEGYIIVKGLFSPSDISEIVETFDTMSHETIPGYFEPDLKADESDPLQRYPRVMHPHRFNDTAMRYMLHQPVMEILADLYGEEAYAAQSMFYYKPPGSRGQALHQDNFYLQVEPGNCIAAWTAIDDAYEDNGGLLVVPKTNAHEISCPDKADSNESFTTHYVKPPKDGVVTPVIMDKGDVLFFNGNLIHGSYRNKTKDQFRRAFICHYANSSAAKINMHYNPLYKADGSEVILEGNPDGGPCGVETTEFFYH
ncbi:phytanoyl-CoA dioxygenase family protein [Paenibacillus silvisoli]|uniref:phytanoyl-CoA dioxygenase family protein n=1 Tax=Paenibacillus silvisoli TaxID=3110539 RepID=UPI00280542CD|nr:phytanoyl-CoA dioxygenase family protein [Paenibacillus silvisoli]